MKKLHTVLLLSLLVLLGGCLEIDGQDVYLRYDEEADRIDALFVYRGVFAEGGNGSSSEPLDKAYSDLEAARKTGEFVFWQNWPISCDPTRDYDPARAALVKHVDVENGGLFTDPQGVLCAYQFIRVNKAQAFVKKLNTLLEVAIQTGFADGLKGLGNRKLDDDTKENVREFLRSREKMIVLEKGRIEVRLPLSQPDHEWLKDFIEDYFLDNMPREITRRAAVAQRRAEGGSPFDTTLADESVSVAGTEVRREITRAPSFRFFWDNEFTFQRAEALTTIGLGVAGQEELRVNKKSSGLYHDAFLKHVREKGDKVEDGLPDQELFRRFEEFRGREAKLPSELENKRG